MSQCDGEDIKDKIRLECNEVNGLFYRSSQGKSLWNFILVFLSLGEKQLFINNK